MQRHRLRRILNAAEDAEASIAPQADCSAIGGWSPGHGSARVPALDGVEQAHRAGCGINRAISVPSDQHGSTCDIKAVTAKIEPDRTGRREASAASSGNDRAAGLPRRRISSPGSGSRRRRRRRPPQPESEVRPTPGPTVRMTQHDRHPESLPIDRPQRVRAARDREDHRRPAGPAAPPHDDLDRGFQQTCGEAGIVAAHAGDGFPATAPRAPNSPMAHCGPNCGTGSATPRAFAVVRVAEDRIDRFPVGAGGGEHRRQAAGSSPDLLNSRRPTPSASLTDGTARRRSPGESCGGGTRRAVAVRYGAAPVRTGWLVSQSGKARAAQGDAFHADPQSARAHAVRPRIRLALLPPKPKELDSTRSHLPGTGGRDVVAAKIRVSGAGYVGCPE